MDSPILLIGIGNEYRCDDSFGLHVVRALKKQEVQDISIVESDGDGAELIEMFKLASLAIVVDAVSAGGKSGTIYRFNVQEQPLPAHLSFQSTHAFGLGEAIELARVLQQLPSTLIVFAIEGENFSTGIGLSPGIEKAFQEVVDIVLREVRTALEHMQTN